MRLRSTANRFPDSAIGGRAPTAADSYDHEGREFPLLQAGDDRISPLVAAAFGTGDPYVTNVRAIFAKVIATATAGGDHRPQDLSTLAVVGIGSGDETSVLSANLAVVFAQLGSETLLVDCGLSDPTIDSLFRVSNEMGVGTTLQSPGAHVAAQPTALPGLHVMPAGPVSAAAQSYIHKQPLLEVIERWGITAGQVIVNLPNVDGGSASLGNILANFDAVLLVTRRGGTKIEEVRRVIDTLDAQKVPIVGSVIA